ncbi:hypothetical protein VNO78_35291 [Psophocarpus tetragonolobus]|uniref:Uncharacterized protein n=1 Tax=Psophocarpus tetragonolobus TaxID=3891 RepID=A0AAN9NS89_PSOTE
MSQDEEEVLSSSWSGSSEGGEFPLIARDKENGISSGKAVTVRERQVVRSRKHRKQQALALGKRSVGLCEVWSEYLVTSFLFGAAGDAPQGLLSLSFFAVNKRKQRRYKQ